MPHLDTDLLASLICRKRDCLLRLREMARKQMDLVASGEITELLDVLAVKQRSLCDLQRTERELAPFRTQDPRERSWRTAEEREQCARQLADCEALLGEIVSLERQSERELVRRREGLAAQLHQMQLAGRARGAYTAESQPEVRRIDLMSES